MVEKITFSGFGIGLRSAHYDEILTFAPDIDWFEIISEDYLLTAAPSLSYLDKICERYPITMHGVSMSLGSADPLNWDYLKSLKNLIQRVNPMWVSDHCCWTGVNQINLHDLLPLPYTEEAIKHVSRRIRQVQDFLERPLIIENVSSYITYKASALSEWEFIEAIVTQADCLLLLDVNNVYVSAFNHGFNPIDYLNGISVDRVQQFHLAGHKPCDTHLIDTHDRDISSDVWDLYAYAVKRFGKVPTLIERDTDIPPLNELIGELNQARFICQEQKADDRS